MTIIENFRVVVRRAEKRDILRLAASLAPDVAKLQVHNRWEENQLGYREMLVAEFEGDIAGTVSFGGARFSRPDSLRWFALDVGAAYRRQGIGTALIESVEQEARRQRLTSGNLEVAVDNVDAIRLYERLGYKRQGDPVVDSYHRFADDGSKEVIEELSWVMVKRL